MIKRLLRLLGFLLVAAGFVVIVIDGTSSIAASALRYNTLGDIAPLLFPNAFASFAPRLTQLHPALWDPVAVTALKAPTSLALIVLGLILLLIGRQRVEGIGYPSRL